MSPYPVLNNRPIDQWKVTELKDELRRRRLPVKGLKDDLVRRLDEALRVEMAQAEEAEAEEAPPTMDEEAPPTKDEEAPPTNDEEAPPTNDEEAGDVPAVAVAEVTLVVAEAEASQPPAVDVLEVSQAPASEASTKGGLLGGNDLQPESVPQDNAVPEEVHPQTEVLTEPIVEKAPEVDASGKVANADDDVASDVAPTDIKSDVATTEVKLDVATTEVKSDVEEASKIQVETLPAPSDAPDAVAMDADVAASALKNNDSESLVPKNDSNDDPVMYDEERKDSEVKNEDSEPILSEPNDQVPAVSSDLGSQIKCESISTDTLSINEKNNLKDNLNADNFDLELEVKPEMVQPSSSIPSLGGDLQPMDDDKELVKNQTSLEEIDYTTNMDSGKKEDSPEGGSPEKLNLDRSSGDESMEEDVMESKQVESNIRSDDLGGKTEVSSGHVVKEAALPAAAVEGSSVDTKELVAEEKPKPAAPTEKRKLEAQEVTKNEPMKRQRRWNVENVKVPERQTSNLSGSNTPKDVFQPALKRSFGRSDSTTSADSPKERIVPPPQKPATTSLRIDRFVRPFTLKAVQELLAKTGSVCSFWMDHIKTHCYVTYSSVEEAVATRDAVYNLQWPPNNGNHLVAEFVDPQEVKLKLEAPPPLPAPISPSPATTPRAAPFQQAQANQTLPRQTTHREQLPPPPPLSKPPTSDPAPPRERLPPPPPKKPESPVMTLDDLFRKTKASPRIYYLPLSEEQVAAKLAAQGKGKRE